jgi:flagellar biogenesis protein FliO
MKKFSIRAGLLASSFFILHSSFAEGTNTPAAAAPLSVPTTSLTDVGPSLLRVFGALALVLAIFLGGVWLFRNWQRLVVQRGRAPRLNVLETRSLGGRHALYVVGYDQERFLIASSPAGVNLVSHLQPAGEAAPENKDAPPQPSFAQALTQVLKGK